LLILVERYDFLEKIRRKCKNGLVAVLKEAFIPLMPVIHILFFGHLEQQNGTSVTEGCHNDFIA